MGCSFLYMRRRPVHVYVRGSERRSLTFDLINSALGATRVAKNDLDSDLSVQRLRIFRLPKQTGSAWLCISKAQNVVFMKELGVYGVRRRDVKLLRMVKPGDELFVFAPGRSPGVAAHCVVEKSLYEATNLDSYGYPFRVGIRLDWICRNGEKVALPWKLDENASIEPNFSLRPLFRLTRNARIKLLAEIRQTVR